MQGWKTRKGSDHSGPDVFWTGREIVAMDNRQIQEPKSIRGQDMSKLKVKYTNSAKAWMTNLIFNQYLKELDEYFKRKGRKIVFFLDNAPVHIVDEATNLTSVL